MVSALKPRGNPLAAGRAGLPRRADGVTARLRDLGGRAPAAARLSLFTGISAAHPSAWSRTPGPGIPGLRTPGLRAARSGTPAGTGTGGTSLPVRAGRPGSRCLPPAPSRWPCPCRGRPHSPRQPPRRPRNRPSRSSPATGCTARDRPRPGNLPVAVHLSPARVALPQAAGAQDAAVVRLTVACGPEPASGAVELDVPAGLAATPGWPAALRPARPRSRALGPGRARRGRARPRASTSSPPGSATSWARSWRTPRR